MSKTDQWVEQAATSLKLLAYLGTPDPLKRFVHELTGDRLHKTAQQNLMRNFIIPFIREMAHYEPHRVDDRNKATVELCKRLLPLIEEVRLPLI